MPVNPVRGGPASTSSLTTGIQMLKYDILSIIEFSSARKRMTVIVRDTKNGQIKVLTKGADSVIMELLSEPDPESSEGAVQV